MRNAETQYIPGMFGRMKSLQPTIKAVGGGGQGEARGGWLGHVDLRRIPLII